MMELLERLGLRQFHLFVSKKAGEEPLPNLREAKESGGYSADQIEELRSATRYFGQANFWRLVFHLPVLLMFWRFDGYWGAGLFLALVLFHTSLIVLETYKASVIQRLRPSDSVTEVIQIVRSETWGEWWFSPKGWETDRVYRWMGMLWFKILVEYVINGLRLTPEQRAAGMEVEYVGTKAEDVIRFENTSRVSELTHFSMALTGVFPVYFAVWHELWLAVPFTILVFYADLGCALLQRLNRRRIWPLVKRFRKQSERREQAVG